MGQEASIKIPAGSKFVLQIDLDAIKQTELGNLLFAAAKKKAMEEFHKGSGEKDLAQLTNMLGFDPFEDIHAVTLSSENYDSPEESLLAIVRLGQTSGNLEGLAVGLPEYEAIEYKEHQIHSASPDQNIRVYGAIHGTKQQNRTVVLSPTQKIISSILDALDGQSSASDDSETIEISGNGSTLVRLDLLELPLEQIGDGPQANMAKIIKSCALLVENGEDNELTINVSLTAENEKQAEQLRQMAQGFIAMISFAQSMDDDDRQLELINELFLNVQAVREDKSVQIGVQLDAEKVLALVSEELELDIDVDVVLDDHKAAERERLEQAQRELEAQLKATRKELEKLK